MQCRWVYGGTPGLYHVRNGGVLIMPALTIKHWKWYDADAVKRNLSHIRNGGVLLFKDGHYEVDLHGEWRPYPDLDTMLVALELHGCDWRQDFMDRCNHLRAYKGVK